MCELCGGHCGLCYITIKNKNMWKLTKKYLKDIWVLLWSKTEVDEKAIATLKEVQKRYKLTVQEIEDVASAMKEVANQIDDIPGALKGKGRKGRK